MMLVSRDLTVEHGLEQVVTGNAAPLASRDLDEAVGAQIEKHNPNFSQTVTWILGRRLDRWLALAVLTLRLLTRSEDDEMKLI